MQIHEDDRHAEDGQPPVHRPIQAPATQVLAPGGSAGQITTITPPVFDGARTQRLSAPSSVHRGIAPRVVVGITVFSLLLGGAAGAGAGAIVAHDQTPTTTAATTGPSPEFQSERVLSGDVSSLSVNVVNQVGPAVVSILNDQQPQNGVFGTTQATSAGSGIIIDKNGYILTNYHVIAQEQNLKVTFANGATTSATLVGGDPTSDIAVIKVATAVPAVATFGDSKAVRPGETVIAIGNALGDLQNTVTEGIISGLGRSLPNGNDPTGNSSLQNLIQTDAAINHGNSGGPLVDLTGHVIGINTAVVRGSSNDPLQTSDQAQGLGFAIPSDTVKAVADRLIFHTPSPYLGIDYLPVSAQMAGAYGLPIGAVVRTVIANSPASHAGLRKNDVITAVNGQAIDAQHDLKTVLDTFHINDTVKLTVNRAGRTLTLRATLARSVG